MEERKVLLTEPIRNPPPSGEKILTVLYTIWAEEHGVVLSDIKITKKKDIQTSEERRNDDGKRKFKEGA
ncbi:hypothetical protein DWY36_02590 [Firmicutes bacterium AF25-13AC]|nr:hypothetical protein DWY36_02590 [Firmicutes bacterium AF25-13AC]